MRAYSHVARKQNLLLRGRSLCIGAAGSCPFSFSLALLKGGRSMRRIGQVIKLKSEAIEEYERLHAAVWPEVLATIAACHISNYTILDRKSTRLNSSHQIISYAVFCLKKKRSEQHTSELQSPY